MLEQLMLGWLVLAVAGAPESPAQVVDAVYRGHFAHAQRIDQTLARERARFATSLLALLDADAKAAAANADEVVGLDFDPLTNAQEEASSYEVGAVKLTGSEATVAVSVRFGSERTALVIRLVQEKGAWKIANIHSGESNLVATLQQLAKERARR